MLKLLRELQNSSPHKIALLVPVALAAALLLIQVCFRRRQPNPLCGFWQQVPKSSIFCWRGVLQFPLFILYLSTGLFFCHCYSEELSKRGFFTDAALLYWKAHEAALSFAVDSDSLLKLAPHAKVENPTFEWDFGFKLGLGYRFPHDRWNLQLQFTSFQTHTDNETKARNGNVLFPLWQKSTTGGLFFAEEAKVHWRLHLGLVDLTLSKCYEVSKTFFLTPDVGIRAGSVRQKYYLDYYGGNLPNGADEIIHMKNKYFGIGPNLGLIGQWSLGGGFSLCAHSLFSVLFGEFYLHQDEYAGKEKLLGVHDIFPSSAAMIDLGAGVCWQRCFHGALKRLKLELAWDELLFFSQNQLLHFTSAGAPGVFFANQGDLFVSGIEFIMRFDF